MTASSTHLSDRPMRRLWLYLLSALVVMPLAAEAVPSYKKKIATEAGASAPFVAIDARLSINNSGVIAFSGTKPDPVLGPTSSLWVWDPADGGDPWSISFFGSGRLFSGASINNESPPWVIATDRVSGAPPTFFVRKWKVGTRVSPTSFVEFGSSPSAFDSATGYVDLNDAGTGSFMAATLGFTPTLMAGQGTPVSVIDFSSGAAFRPQSSNLGTVVLQKATSIWRKDLPDAPASDLTGVLNVTGADSSFTFSASGQLPGISADGTAIAFYGTGTFDYLNNAGVTTTCTNCKGIFLNTWTGGAPPLKAYVTSVVAGDELHGGALVDNVDPAPSATQRVAVLSQGGAVETSGGYARIQLVTVFFVGTYHGSSAVLSVDLLFKQGQFVARAEPRVVAVDGEEAEPGTGKIISTAVSPFSLYDPVAFDTRNGRRDTYVAFTVGLSNGNNAILFATRNCTVPNAKEPKYSQKQYDVTWADALYGNYLESDFGAPKTSPIFKSQACVLTVNANLLNFAADQWTIPDLTFATDANFATPPSGRQTPKRVDGTWKNVSVGKAGFLDPADLNERLKDMVNGYSARSEIPPPGNPPDSPPGKVNGSQVRPDALRKFASSRGMPFVRDETLSLDYLNLADGSNSVQAGTDRTGSPESYERHQASLRRIIDFFVCNGKLIEARVHNYGAVGHGNHSVLVTGVEYIEDQQKTTYTVNDPGSGLISRLTDTPAGGRRYDNTILGVRPWKFSYSQPRILIAAFSPVELVVTDPLGRRLGYDPLTDMTFREILNASYTKTFDEALDDGSDVERGLWVAITGPENVDMPIEGDGNGVVNGIYQVRVVGTGSGPYRLEITGVTDAGDEITRVVSGVTTAGKVEDISVQFSRSLPSAFGVERAGLPTPLSGDVNLDGVVDVSDAAEIVRAIGRPAMGVSDPSDVDVDGAITVLDVLALGIQSQVPPVQGLSLRSAVMSLNDKGLVGGTVVTEQSLVVPEGFAMRSTPVEGSSIAAGTAVALTIAAGAPPLIAVPDVVGQTQAAAQTAIMGAGLALGTVTTQSSPTVLAGSVISQNPTAGTSVAAGSAVNLVVSLGAAMVSVPNVVGLTHAAATTAITTAGLAVGAVNAQSSPTVAAGNVISQTPNAGTSVAGGSVVTLVVSSGSTSPPVITEFSTGITAGARPYNITAGPDGNLWFTEVQGDRIGRITPLGVVTEFRTGITAASFPFGITAGPDGNLWFAEQIGNKIGRITPDGVVTEFSAGISAGATPEYITAGPDGNLWFTEWTGNRIGRITPLGVVTEFSVGITPVAYPFGITAGPDGNLWFTEYGGNRIGRITPLGVVTEFSAGITAGAGLSRITAGPDGNLWFTEQDGNRIGRITPLGVVTEFSAGISPGASPRGITAGPDGNLWFTESGVHRIGRITPLGVVTEFSAGITPNAAPFGITAGPDGNLWFTEGDGNRIGRITLGAAAPPVVASVGSRKVHGAAGTLDLALALTPANPTTEPRQGPAFTFVFTFDKAVTDGTAHVTEGTATAGAPTFSGNEMQVPLTGVANEQYVTVAVSNVDGADGTTGGGGSIRVGFLMGDVNQNRVVTLSDLGQVNAQVAQFVTAANYLKDVNASGTLSLADKGITNAQITKALPAP